VDERFHKLSIGKIGEIRMNSRYNQLMSTIFLGIFLLTGCIPSRVNRYFKNGGCELPCWNNIVPDETTAQDAIKILETSELIDPMSVRRTSVAHYFPTNQIFFSFIAKGMGNAGIENGLVSIIHLTEIQVSVNEMFENYGEPNYFSVIPYWQLQWYATYIYPEKGLIFQTINRQRNVNLEFIETGGKDIVKEMYIFDPQKYDSVITYISYLSTVDDHWNVYDIIQEWKGFGDIPILGY